MIVADLHIHSRFSRATAKNLTPESLWLAAQLKGIGLLGTGDFTHPEWHAELCEKLAPTGDGAYVLRPELAAPLADKVPGPCQGEVRFLPSAEISSIYKRHGQTRKVHSLIIMPDLEAAARLNARLGALGNIVSDGRPILGLDARDLLELCLEVEPSVIFIPAHIWTPWFSVFGSKSGFDSLEECFDDLTGHIHALETGLSSDPPMNWRLSALDGYTLVSHSDAHSPAKLAREADLLTCAPTYPALAAALADPAQGFAGTLEFFPDEGKYHLDGHRKCGLRLSPEETREHGGRCPVCGGLITVGVLSRVEDLADRPLGARPNTALDFESIIPLAEVVGEVLGRGPATKGVVAAVDRLLHELGPELFVLRAAEADALERAGGPVLAEAIRRMRAGQVITQPGYDGEFGKIGLFTAQERQEIKGQRGLWKEPPGGKAKAKAKPQAAPSPGQADAAPLFTPLDPAAEGLNPEQAAAVAHAGGHLVVRAGPGSGKTRVLVQRALRLVEDGLAPARLALITFTRKAAGELAQRLGDALPAASGVYCGTFHALGRQVLESAQGGAIQVVEEDQRQAILRAAATATDAKPGELELAVSRFKQGLERTPPEDLAPGLGRYQAGLDQAGAVDLDDLVRGAALALLDNADLAASWQGRFSHIMADEYQDVNPAQVALLQALAGDAAQVTVIGDPDQAIYGFRGADRGLFARFGRDFPNAAIMGLTMNYRSQAAILSAAQAVINADPDPNRANLRPALGAGPLPVEAALADAQAEARWVAARVAALLGGLDSRQVEAGGAAGDYAPREVAVLYRLHAMAGPLAEALREAGVPVQVASKEPLAETDPLDARAQRVSLLSMHAAKGLEWPVVFVTGLEEGLLPYEPPGREPAAMDEERRLLFVAMTRARERLFLSRAQRRTMFGQTRQPGRSPLLAPLGRDMVVEAQAPKRAPKARQLGLFG